MVKVTFTLDDETVAKLRRSAERRKKPQSMVVREAIAEYAARDDKLSDEERNEWLRTFRTFLRKKKRRPQSEVDAEIREIRAARRRGGRLHPSK